MDEKVWIPIAAAAVAAIVKVGYDIVNSVHQSRLSRVNAQIELLYGPLRALVRAGDAAWHDFRKQVRPPEADPFFKRATPPTERDLAAWTLWMSEVFVPLHAKMEQVILANVHLIEGAAFPPAFDSLFAHIAGYKAALAKWNSEEDLSAPEYADYYSTRNYPASELISYIETTYQALAARQTELLRGPLA